MKIVTFLILLHGMLLAANSQYLDSMADKIFRDSNATLASAFGFSMDLGYTNYKIDVISSELNRAIDYNILELSLGLSYSYDAWLWGIVVKSQVEEFQSNVIVERGGGLLNDFATIDRAEVSLYTGYKINDFLRLHVVLRSAKLEATDSYTSYIDYATNFYYQTRGLAISLLYHQTFWSRHAFWGSMGLDYSRAIVSIVERINGIEDDAYIDDNSDSLGWKVGLGYTYLFSKNIILKLGADYYKFDFGALDVDSRMQNSTLEKAFLFEETYALRAGVVYRF